MRILIAHVRYRYAGGEESVVETEARILRAAGHEVRVLQPESRSFDELPALQRLGIGLSGGEHEHGRALIGSAIAEFEPDIVHFHNLYPLLGVGAMREASARGCAVVQTLHNYRLTCIAGTHLRQGRVCEACTLSTRVPGVLNQCYRGSLSQSAAMALATTRQTAALAEVPHVVLTLTQFAADRLVSQGVPAEKVLVKPNSVEAGAGGPFGSREGVVCVARLSEEKGVLPLAEAWPDSAPVLTIVGSGPQEQRLAALAQARPNVVLTGRLASDEVRAHLRTARVAVVPSPGYEGMPLSVLEAFSEGTPVLFLGVRAREELAGASECGEPTIESLVGAALRLHDDVAEWSKRSAEVTDRYRSAFSHASNVVALERAYARALAVKRGQ